MIPGLAIASAAVGGAICVLGFADAVADWRKNRDSGRVGVLTTPVLTFLAAAVFFLIAAGLAVADAALGATRLSASTAVISFVDVGQGDGVVMRVGKQIVVSDAGELKPDHVDSALHNLGATRIDVAILTHPHKDHVKNFLDLLDIYKWKIKAAVLSHSAWWDGTKTNRLLIKTLKQHRVKLHYVTTGARFRWGGASWEVLSPPTGRYTGGASQAANASVVYVLTVKGIRLLFTGDIASPADKEVANLWTKEQLGRATIFLATHHGSATGSTKELLAAIDPRWAVLSTGPNTYEHPSPEAIARLEIAGASIWCTAVNGTVTATISAKGRLSWRSTAQPEPWWSAGKQLETGLCVDQ